MLESPGAKLCQKPGLQPVSLASHLNKKNISDSVCKLDFSFKSYPQENKQNEAIHEIVNAFICQLIKNPQKPHPTATTKKKKQKNTTKPTHKKVKFST